MECKRKLPLFLNKAPHHEDICRIEVYSTHS